MGGMQKKKKKVRITSHANVILDAGIVKEKKKRSSCKSARIAYASETT